MNYRWTNVHIPDLSGKVAVVTGANSGIGFETAKELARNKAIVVMACRNKEKAEASLNNLRSEIPNIRAEVLSLDLSRLESIRNFAALFQEKYNRLDILINNAGIMKISYEQTAEGVEKHFGVNHLGHFALTGLLLNSLLATPGSRVITISSLSHWFGNINFRALKHDAGKRLFPLMAYGRSKLANILFANELQRRLEINGSKTISVAAHPGITVTNLTGHFGNQLYDLLVSPILIRIGQNTAKGALPGLRAATDPDITGGKYIGPTGIWGIKGYPAAVQSSGKSQSSKTAKLLWEISEELTGVHYL